MKWSEIQELYPNKFVVLQSLKERIEGNYIYFDEVALIEVIEDDKKASNLLTRCRGSKFIYHTSNELVYMEIRRKPIIRMHLR